MTRKISAKQRKGIVSPHIQGEIDCFNECYNKLNGEDEALNNKKGEIAEPYRRICLESFLLHVRNLYNFLYIEPKYRNDVSANDFYTPITNLNKNAPINRINKQLSHITYDRLTPEQKDLFPKRKIIYDAIIRALDEYNQNVEKEYQLKTSLTLENK